MRKVLNSVYVASGYLAGLFLFLTFAIILTQVFLNMLQVLVQEAAGIQFKVMIPSYSEFATYSFAAASFLGLGYTHRHNGHIRVVVLSLKLPVRVRAWLELWCLGFATVVAGYFAYFAVDQVILSYSFQDVSSGLIAVPLWLPQSGMAAGLLILATALIDDLLVALMKCVRSADVDVCDTATPWPATVAPRQH